MGIARINQTTRCGAGHASVLRSCSAARPCRTPRIGDMPICSGIRLRDRPLRCGTLGSAPISRGDVSWIGRQRLNGGFGKESPPPVRWTRRGQAIRWGAPHRRRGWHLRPIHFHLRIGSLVGRRDSSAAKGGSPRLKDRRTSRPCQFDKRSKPDLPTSFNDVARFASSIAVASRRLSAACDPYLHLEFQMEHRLREHCRPLRYPVGNCRGKANLDAAIFPELITGTVLGAPANVQFGGSDCATEFEQKCTINLARAAKSLPADRGSQLIPCGEVWSLLRVPS